MSDHRLTEAAVEGFRDSLRLANDLVVGLVRAPLAVVNSFVHHDRRKDAEDENGKRTAEPSVHG